jgi:hypothetical protein
MSRIKFLATEQTLNKDPSNTNATGEDDNELVSPSMANIKVHSKPLRTFTQKNKAKFV